MMDTALGSQVALSVLIVHLLEILKRSAWFPWLTMQSDKILKLISVVISAGAAIGITFVMEGNSAAGWHIAVTIPPLSSLIDLLAHFLTQFGVSQAYYHGVVKK